MAGIDSGAAGGLVRRTRLRPEPPQVPRDSVDGLQAFRDRAAAVIVAQRKGLADTVAGSLDDEAAAECLVQRRQALAPWVDGLTRIILLGLAFQLATELRLGGKCPRAQRGGEPPELAARPGSGRVPGAALHPARACPAFG